MMYISLSLRYHRQLGLICPDVVESFFREAVESAVQKGGKVLRSFSNYVFSFDNSDLCCVFSVSLFIDSLLSMIKAREDRIKEYLIFVDYSENDIPQENIADRKAVCDNMILEDGAVLLDGDAASLLRSYADCVRIENSPLYYYCGHKIRLDFSADSEAKASLPESVFLYPPPGDCADGKSSVVSAFINVISGLKGCFAPENFLSKKETAVLNSYGRAVSGFSSLRFSSVHPDYRLKGCREYIKLFFTAVSRARIEGKQEKLTTVEIPGGYFDRTEISAMESLLEDTCSFSFTEKEHENARTDVAAVDGFEIPADIMDAAYLLYRASSFLYSGEISSLFAFLGKQDGTFLKAVQLWLSASGFPGKTGFLSLVSELEKKDFPPLANRGRLDKYLFDFLWSKYEGGSILAGRDFLRNLIRLGQRIPDSFLAAAVFKDSDPREAAAALQPDFSDGKTASAIINMVEAEKKLRRGMFREARETAKNALHDFQRSGIVSGEYEVFSFYARFSFAKHGVSGGDSVTYMEYAYENAEKMRDPDARMRCFFDFASIHLLSGNFCGALANVKKLREAASLFYDKDWEAVSLFLEGKISFLLGDYKTAEKQFHNTEMFCSSYGITKAFMLCRVWASRSRIYQIKNPREYETLKNLAPAVPEAWLFALEELVKKKHGGNQHADSLQKDDVLEGFPADMRGVYSPEIFVSPEKWSWGSSFSLTDDRFLCGIKCGRILYPLYSAFLAFCTALYGGDCDAAKTEIDNYAKETQSFRNPYLYIFYYMCYELENLSSWRNSTDALSFLSRSFKSIQLDANNISDTVMREKFLREPYWNSLLFSAARENKLI